MTNGFLLYDQIFVHFLMGHDKLSTDPFRISLNRRKISANFLTVHRLGLNAFHWINNHYSILGIRIPDIIYLELKLSRAASFCEHQYNYHHTLPVLTINFLGFLLYLWCRIDTHVCGCCNTNCECVWPPAWAGEGFVWPLNRNWL
jgi:hypothetical protein